MFSKQCMKMIYFRQLAEIIPIAWALIFGASVAHANKGPQSPSGPLAAAPPQVNNSEMLIGSGDLLEVSVYGTDFDKQVRVNDTGEISLPLLGSLKVSGLSIHGAEQAVAKDLVQGGYFNNPQVSIFEREFATQGISVLGEVQKPGIYPLPGDRNLFDAISAAGGVTPRAGDKVTITHRGQPDRPESVKFSYTENQGKGRNPRVFPGDTVVMSKAGIVYVVGDVHEPKGIVMDNAHLTVLQAVAMAQGTNSTAALNGAKIIRKSGDGPQETPIQLKKILSAKAPDLPLQPDDILFIPSSKAKTAGKRTIDAIIETATGVAIYHPL